MSSEKAGGGAGAGKDQGWAAKQVGPEKRRRQLIPDLRGAAFQHFGNPSPHSTGLSGPPQMGAWLSQLLVLSTPALAVSRLGTVEEGEVVVISGEFYGGKYRQFI